VSKETVETLRFFHPTPGDVSRRVDKAAQRCIHLGARAPYQSGFSLIELAIVLVVVALLLGGLLVPLTTQIEQQKIRETQKAMEEIKEALIGFAIVNGRLPRPAQSATNGAENPTTCASRPSPTSEAACTGFVPWETLGVSKLDAWGKIFRYSVTPGFADASFSLTLSGSKNVKTREATPPFNEISLATNVPAVIFSYGARNLGTGDMGNILSNGSSTNFDEVANDTASTTFYSRTSTEVSSPPGGEFDDLVTWLSPNILFNRMVAAGRLP
jgi:prepilin-type N-terminal cleavage/methylation domain-containing protein